MMNFKNLIKNTKIINCIMCFILATLFFYRLLTINFISPGLDPSWSFALNYFSPFAQGWNPDFIFTYGPLGFLIHPLNVGYNINASLIICGCISFIISAAIVHFISDYSIKQKSLAYALLFLLLLFFPLTMDYIIICIALLFMIFILQKNWKYSLPLIPLLYLSFFLKITMIIALLPAVLLLLCILCFQKRYKDVILCAVILLFWGLSLCLSAYFCFSHLEIINYIKGSLEVSKGYNSAMSLVTDNDYTIIPCLYGIFILYCLTDIILFFFNRPLFILFSIYLFPIFLALKHAAVRSDGHVFVFTHVSYWIIILLTLSFILIKKSCKFSFQKTSSIIFFILSLLCSFMFLYPTFPMSWQLNHLNLVQRIRDIKNQDLSLLPSISKEFLSEIKDSSFTIYPWDISLIATSQKLNYVALPCVQIYSNYTPYIDKKTSKFFKNKKAKYIIFEDKTIDNRWHFIENPQTWTEIKKSYSPILNHRKISLWKLSENNKQNTIFSQKEEHLNCALGSKLTFPDNKDNNFYISINCQKSLLGNLASIFYKIPPTNLVVEYQNGIYEEKRILLDNIKSPFYLKDFFSKPIKSMKLTGVGLMFYSE